MSLLVMWVVFDIGYERVRVGKVGVDVGRSFDDMVGGHGSISGP